MKRAVFILASAAMVLSACSSTPAPSNSASSAKSYYPQTSPTSGPAQMTPIPQSARFDYDGRSLSLPDRAAFLQKDERWASDQLGHTASDTMGTDGCLVTASAMALNNLGFETDPGDLNKRLTEADSFTPRGWLIWSGISKVTGGKAKARFHNEVSEEIINSCMRDGYYPMARFVLPNGRTHWAVILKRDAQGYHMRDPLQPSRSPLIFPRGAEAFKAVRCIGLDES